MSITHGQNDLQELKIKVFKIVDKADLSTMTAKQVRQELERHFDRDLTNEKSRISEFIKEALQKRIENDNDDKKPQDQDQNSTYALTLESDRQLALQLQGEESKRPKRLAASSTKSNRTNGTKKVRASKERDPCRGFPECRLTPIMSEFMNGMDKATSSLVTKAIWEHIKTNNLQDPSRKQWIECDDTLYALFKKKRIHMFKIPAAVQNHLLRDYE